MYNINDTILYGTTGVCKIADICEKKFKNKKVTYYVLSPVFQNNSTVYVPTDNEMLVSRMKRVLSADEIHRLIREMPDGDGNWVDNDNERAQRYNEIIKSGDRKALIGMIRTLYLHEKSQLAQGRKFHSTDERFLREAESLLYSEFAHVLGIHEDEVLQFIIDEIEGEEQENNA